MGADRLLLRPKLDLRPVTDVRTRMGIPPRSTRSSRRTHLRRHSTLYSHGPHLDRPRQRRRRLLRRPGGVQLDPADHIVRPIRAVLHQSSQSREGLGERELQAGGSERGCLPWDPTRGGRNHTPEFALSTRGA